MTTSQTKKRTNLGQRTAFTLVELMIVIVIIGILAAIASPFIFGALERAREFAIQNEIDQLDAAVRKFETEHGFFPPAIGPGLEIDTDDPDAFRAFRPYLNRIAPNHDEGTGISNDGLQNWWNVVGSKLDAESSIVFWLSGLCTSKQYPLSGNAMIRAMQASTPNNIALAPYNVNHDAVNDDELRDGNGDRITIDRNVFFDFDLGRLVSNGSTAGIKSYNQPQGKDDALAYQYLDRKSYFFPPDPNDPSAPPIPRAYHIDQDPDPMVVDLVFFNPDTFQIICPGMDGVISSENSPVTNLTDETDVDPAQDDNITNFSNGRLERSYGG